MPDLDYVKVIGRLGIVVRDEAADDPNLEPDTIWCDEGQILFTPLLTSVKVVGADPVPATLGQSTIIGDIDTEGYLTLRGVRSVQLVDLTSLKVNPFIGPGKATHRVEFQNLMADGQPVTFPSPVNVRFSADTADAFGNCDLTLLMPVPVAGGTAQIIGRDGVSVLSMSIVDNELVYALSDLSTGNAGVLPQLESNEQYMTAAQNSATAAATSATNASTSATNASGSATAANTSKNAAATSATNAATSETNANTSKNAAATSATNASTSATNAGNSASAASTSATNAGNSATAAATSATNAGNSATAAATSATNASNSATAAGTSATNAATSATNANNAKTAAETARDAAVTARTGAETARTGAETARTGAETARTGAEAARDAAAQSAIEAENAAGGGVTSLNGQSGALTLNQDNLPDGTTNRSYTQVEKTKLAGIATGATANATDAQLRDRATHTGTQAASTITGLAAIATSGSASHITTGTLPTSVLPPLAVNETFTVASQAAMLALTAQRGDMAIRTDNGRTYVLSTDSPATLADWKEVMAAGQVTSVAGKTGVVSLVKGDVGLGNVDNTSDLAKPISTATQTALDGKSDTAHLHDDRYFTETEVNNLLTTNSTNDRARANHTGTQAASTITGLASIATSGSAADLSAGTIPDARLPTRLSATSSTLTDWNTALTPGWYKATDAANAPGSGWVAGQVVAEINTVNVTQVVYRHVGGALSEKYRRIYASGTWGNWHRDYEGQTELDSRYLLQDNTASALWRTGHNITGGGTISTTAGGAIGWSTRFVVISNGRGAHFGTGGYFDITCPADGTVITGVGGASDTTVSGNKITLNIWQALYYILPIGAGTGSVPANFRVMNYTSDFVVPDEWVLLAVRNAENSSVRFGNGANVVLGLSWTAADPTPQYADDVHTHPFTAVTGVIDTAQLPARLRENSTAAFVADANTATTSGFYQINNTSTNGPTVGGYYNLLVLSWTSATYATQIASEVNTKLLHYRQMTNGTWGSWVQIGSTVNSVFTNDARLSDARTPTTHTHTLTDLPDAWVKRTVKAASTANVAIPPGGTTLTVDTIVMANGDRVLLKNQTTPAQNGIYVVGGIGSSVILTRATDADIATELAGATTSIDQGSQGGQVWSTTFKSTDTVGTTAVNFYREIDTSLLAPNGGTTAGTVVQANDTRLSDARTPTTHTHDDRYFTETETTALLTAINNFETMGGM